MLDQDLVASRATLPPAFPLGFPTIDLLAVKRRQQATWASGDFAVIGTTLQFVGESLAEAADVHAGERVLDVACGNGNAALAAARRWAHVTGVDYVPALLDKARTRAEAEGLPLELVLADAEVMPFHDASFDLVMSTFGVMFTPSHFGAAAELVRVCRPGGRIALASWTPDGFIGELLALVGRYVPPPAGLISPSAWGVPEHLERLFGDRVTRLDVARREFVFRYASAAHFVDVFRTYYGPTHKAFAALDAGRAAALEADIHALLARWDRGRGRSLIVPATYLEAIATRR
ncbi:MAG: class I SAM-dependent methyltransferase [Deltaproteobacteria bacterium]|nr:class I SAM-dependent methyltransferase [Deltaproteobacteria bacterium]